MVWAVLRGRQDECQSWKTAQEETEGRKRHTEGLEAQGGTSQTARRLWKASELSEDAGGRLQIPGAVGGSSERTRSKGGQGGGQKTSKK